MCNNWLGRSPLKGPGPWGQLLGEYESIMSSQAIRPRIYIQEDRQQDSTWSNLIALACITKPLLKFQFHFWRLHIKKDAEQLHWLQWREIRYINTSLIKECHSFLQILRKKASQYYVVGINAPIAQRNELNAKWLHVVSLGTLFPFSFVFALLIHQLKIYFVDFI